MERRCSCNACPFRLAVLHLPLIVLLDECDGVAVIALEELGIFAGVEELALLCSVGLLLQHPAVAVGHCTIQDMACHRALVVNGMPPLLYEVYVVRPIDDARALHRLDRGATLELLQEAAVAEVLALVE